jgi:probable rRNA maturation factor
MVRKIATETLNALVCPNAELSISLVSDKKITELNRDYLQRSRPTDVLAFSMHEGEFGQINPNLLGDVVVSIETARAQAEKQGCGFNEELCLLVVHGILHLVGFDHEGSRLAAKKMREKEQELVSLMREKGIV